MTIPHRSPRSCVASIVVALIFHAPASAQVERVWLTHKTNDPSKIVVSWTSKSPGDSTVRFGPTKDYGDKAHVSGSRTLHHVEIPLPKKGGPLHYSVVTGEQASPDAVIHGYPTETLRVAVVADWHRKPNLRAIDNDKIHLLLTAGDNISSLYQSCGNGTKDCTKPFEALIGAYPEMFRSIPFLPVLGNHDRMIQPHTRGQPAPKEAVYDVAATAFCKFFALPDDKWKWHFDVPAFHVRFIALDLNHIEDLGTTLQSCHDFRHQSPQFQWYEKLMDNRPKGFVVTLHNELNSRMRGQEKGAWGRLFHKSNLVISGSGFYAERDEVEGVTFLNTSLAPPMTEGPKPKRKFHADEPSYVLMTFHQGSAKMTVELKSLEGKVLDRAVIAGHK